MVQKIPWSWSRKVKQQTMKDFIIKPVINTTLYWYETFKNVL